MFRKLAFSAATTAAAVVLAAGPAFAHFCSVANRSDAGNEAVLKSSQNWATFRELAPVFLCPAGSAYLISTADAQGLDIDSPVNLHSVMGGGALEQGHPAQGITYAFGLFPVFEAAEALCPAP